MPNPPGLFITGTDTGVGKTYVAALIARSLAAAAGAWAFTSRRPADASATRKAAWFPTTPWPFGKRPAGRATWSTSARSVSPPPWPRTWPPGPKAERSTPSLLRSGTGLLASAQRNRARRRGRRADVAAGRRTSTWPTWPGISAFPLIVVSRNMLGTINATLQTLIHGLGLSRRAGGCRRRAQSSRRRRRPTTSVWPPTAPNSPPAAPRRCWPVWGSEQASSTRSSIGLPCRGTNRERVSIRINRRRQYTCRRVVLNRNPTRTAN